MCSLVSVNVSFNTTHLKNVISDIIDLHGRCSIAFVHLGAEQALQAWRSRDEDDFMAIKYFTLNSVCAVAKNET